MAKMMLAITAAGTIVVFGAGLADYTRSLAKNTDHKAPEAFAITVSSSTSSSNRAIISVQNAITGDEIQFQRPGTAKTTIGST
jgi:hypothetical protein